LTVTLEGRGELVLYHVLRRLIGHGSLTYAQPAGDTAQELAAATGTTSTFR
jgi:hypothetical protein